MGRKKQMRNEPDCLASLARIREAAQSCINALPAQVPDDGLFDLYGDAAATIPLHVPSGTKVFDLADSDDAAVTQELDDEDAAASGSQPLPQSALTGLDTAVDKKEQDDSTAALPSLQQQRVKCWDDCDPADLDFSHFSFTPGGSLPLDASEASPVLGQFSEHSVHLGNQCEPSFDSNHVALGLPVLPFTPPDEGEAGSVCRSVARPLGHVNAEGAGGLDGAPTTVAGCFDEGELCALDDSDTLGYDYSLGPQSDIHVSRNLHGGPDMSAFLGVDGDTLVEETSLPSASTGTGSDQSHTQHAPCAKETTATSGSEQPHTQHAPCAHGQSSLQHPVAPTVFYLYAKQLLPDVYGDSDDDLVGFPFDRDDADLLDSDSPCDEQDAKDAALPLVGTCGDESPASSSLDSLAALELFGSSLEPGSIKDILMAFLPTHRLLLEKAAALRSDTCVGTEHAQQAPCAQEQSHHDGDASSNVGIGGNSHAQHSPCARLAFGPSQQQLVFESSAAHTQHTPCAKIIRGKGMSRGKGKTMVFVAAGNGGDQTSLKDFNSDSALAQLSLEPSAVHGVMNRGRGKTRGKGKSRGKGETMAT